jgi:antibiotic biosynthesis monooxygenase (ABM) superfamily enzyme
MQAKSETGSASVAYKQAISAESEQDIAIDIDMKSQGDTGVTRAIELEATERLRADSVAIQIQSKLDSPTSKDLLRKSLSSTNSAKADVDVPAGSGDRDSVGDARKLGVLIVTRHINGQYEDKYRRWCDHFYSKVMSKWDGFVSVRVYPPIENSHNYWTTIAKFSSQEKANSWIDYWKTAHWDDTLKAIGITDDHLSVGVITDEMANALTFGIPVDTCAGPAIAGAAKVDVPPVWKRVLVVVMVFYPLSVVLGWLWSMLWTYLKVGSDPFSELDIVVVPMPLRSLISTANTAPLTIAVGVPYLSEKLRPWLFNGPTRMSAITENTITAGCVVYLCVVCTIASFTIVPK